LGNLTQLADATNAPPFPRAGDSSIREHWVVVEGVRIRYLQAGSGPAVLLIHGLMGYSFSWRFNIAALAEHANVYAIDMPGLGFSARATVDCSMQGLARFLLRFMDAAGIASADVLGTSHGGAVAMMMAALDAARVRRLILVAPVNPWAAGRLRLIALLATPPGAFMARKLAPVIRRSRGLFLRRVYGDPQRVTRDTISGYGAPLKIPGTIEHVLCILKSWHSDIGQLQAALPRITDVPTLLLWGTRDPAVLPASAAKLQQNFRNSHLVLIEGAGHLPYEEMPDEFNRALLDFLRSRQKLEASSPQP
jgi:pimeloyl-ACP methyl ester carboxylesterase